ncbi:MAG: sialate O-acetylesterase, partial [Kiritimatiellales bacterium]|nr:sialate O-acetylesterase [Kiritimatiellales bacterium]
MGLARAATPVDLSVLPEGIDRVDVFLLMGQSNMKGRGIIPAVQTENPLIANMNMADNQWYVALHPLHKAGVPDLIDGSDNAGVGPGLDFARGVLSRTNGVMVALVPCAVGGSWINLWQPGQPFYTNAIFRAQKALADAPPGKARIKGVLWLQGESDAIEARYAAYESKLSTLVQSLRADLNEPELPFIACTIGTFINSNNYPYVAEINNSLLTLPERELNTACVDARDVTGHIGDNMHYNTDSQIIIGQRYADQYAALTAEPSSWTVLVNDNLDAGQGSWATRAALVGTVVFADAAVKVSPHPTNGQPGAAYLSFSTVTLQDGATLRMTVDVSTTDTLTDARNLRIGLGSANPLITGNSTTITVPLTGYSCSAPSGGNATDPRVSWVNSGAGALNFFNSSTALIGDMALDNSVSVGTNPVTWVWAVTRSGSDLIFSGSLGGTAFGSTVVASGANVISNFQFNTVGLGYAYSMGEVATYDNVRLEVSDVAVVSNAPVRLAALFSSGCVLQRDQSVAVWGVGEPLETLTVSVKDQSKTAVADSSGAWRVELDSEPAGGPFALTVSGTHSSSMTLTNVYFGDVWLLTGQSNMEQSVGTQSANFPGYYPAFPNSGDNFDDVRFALIKQIELAAGPASDVAMDLPWTRWQGGQLADMSAVGYFFARELKAALEANGHHVPLGFIKVCKGATAAEQWISPEALAGMGEALIPRVDKPASTWYNGMIAPLQDYAVKGVLWYQGETSADTIDRIGQYPLVFETLVQSWRAQWNNPELPFYYVQLAPYYAYFKVPKDRLWDWMRGSQAECLSTTNTYMACIIDSGLQGDIHPPFKDRVGERLARLALEHSYGIPTISRGPTLLDIQINGSEAVLAFDHVADGLQTQAVDAQPDADEIAQGKPPVSVSADELAGFALCGSDHVFYWATDAEIIGANQVRIANVADVPEPVAIRYAWDSYPRCNLFNDAGLPAEPFRTDAYGFNTSTGADSTPVPVGIPAQNVRTNQSLLEIDLTTAFKDVEDGADALSFSIEGISDTNVVGSAIISNRVLRILFSNMAGTSTITVRAQDSAGNHADLSFKITVGQEYLVWRDGHFTGGELGNPALESALWGDLADPDSDHIPNLLEYALALDPRQPDQHLQLLSIVVEPGTIKARFRASRQALADPFVGVGLQASTNLAIQDGWAILTTPDTPYQDLGDAELREVVLATGSGGSPACFVRIYASRLGN